MKAFTFREWYAIEQALRLAAEQFRQDARACVDAPRLAAQFEHQAIDAQALADRIENEAQPEAIAAIM
jgi:hypothetical protein